MSKKEIQEYLNFLNIVDKRLASLNQILTINKTKIIEILFENSEHLSVIDIVKISNNQESNCLTTTTVYRVLSSFEAYGIVDSITVDDKKRYELLYFKKPHYHLYCQECHKIAEFESLDIHDMFLTNLKSLEFQSTNFNVIINGVCKKCQAHTI